jgi:hypothetical protein
LTGICLQRVMANDSNRMVKSAPLRAQGAST